MSTSTGQRTRAGAMADRSDELTDAERGLLAARAARYARIQTQVSEEREDVVRFERGDGRYAVLITDLREIRPLRRLCRIPGAAPVAPGVFYYRGEILSAHDLGCFLVERELPGTPPWVLILELSDGPRGERFGLLADNITGISAVVRPRLQPLPVTLGDRASCFHGALDGGELLIHPERLTQCPEFIHAF